MRQMTVAEAKAAGFLDGPVKKPRVRSKDYSEDRGPYDWRCTACGTTGHGETAAKNHQADTGHCRYETIIGVEKA